MNYVYNIKVNLKEKLINFYEWTHDDKITIIKKIKIFFVSDKDYNNIINMNIRIKDNFLDEIISDNNMCLFTNNIDIVCTKFNNKKEICRISKLELDEEKEILDEMKLKKKLKLEYNKITKNNRYKYITRFEEKIKNELLKYIDNKKDNSEIIDYLYYEWFHCSKSKDKFNDLINSVTLDYSQKHEDLYKIIELINS